MADFKILVNFKTYKEGTGEKAVKLAKVCEQVSKEKRVEIIPVVQVVDLFRVKREVKIPVWVQNVDWQPQGQFTGFTNLEAIIEAGAGGTLLNHSEHQIPPGTVRQTLARCSKFNVQDSKFKVMVCCKTLGQMEKLVKFEPDYLAYEIAELIGTTTSICETVPRAIEHAVEICGQVPLIVGAGVHSKKDLKVARKLGAKGVLIASAVVLAKDPEKKLEELI
jgi:triosephosphate isomerase